MKIAISATAQELTSELDPRFGRCAYFTIVETDGMNCETIPNEGASASGGAGIQSAQLLASKNVEAVITGNCGPNAASALSAAGINLYTGQFGTVADALDRFKNGELVPAKGPNVGDHYGSGGGGGRGMGRGMGMGKGGGRGRR